MAFQITIEQFEGPLDLMLHLIKENKLDLFDLDMNVLTTQYLAYLDAMESLHLEIASEYLSELAGLIEYKSKKLLPCEKVEISEEYEEDQREKLVQRLLEYQRFKEVSALLSRQYEDRQMLMGKPLSEETSKWIEASSELPLAGNPYDLIKAMQKVMRRQALLKPYETRMTIKELSLDERVVQMRKRLDGWSGKMSFEELCSDCTSLHMVIVTFLGVLDLIKLKAITYTIDEDDVIWIIKGDEYHGS